jgi:hypothetical protein
LLIDSHAVSLPVSDRVLKEDVSLKGATIVVRSGGRFGLTMMSTTGQSLPIGPFSAMSGLPPVATELRTSLEVRIVHHEQAWPAIRSFRRASNIGGLMAIFRNT